VFEKARQLGFYTSAHAGEAAGSSSIWGVINSLKVDRIGHGTRAYEDPLLIEHLIEKGIPLEVCPTSNLCTGVVASISEHPVRSYFEKGLSLTINTDDPVMFDTSLAREYHMLMTELNFSRDDIKSLILNGIQTSWQSADQKKMLQKQFTADPDWDT
jgi:adenosine deaminase